MSAIPAQSIANPLNLKGISENSLRKVNLQPIEFKEENASAGIAEAMYKKT